VIELPIAGGFYKSSVIPVNTQCCVNAYPVITQSADFERHSLFGTPGLNQLTSVDTGFCRGALEMADVPYFVIGETLYRLNRTVMTSVDSFSTTTIGTIPGSTRVSMAQNGDQLMVLVPGGNGYIYDRTTDTFAQITDSDFVANGNPQHVIFIDSYFVCSTDTDKFICSNVNDGTSWDALDAGTAEADPDAIVAPAALNSRLFMLGSKTIQPFQNIGGSAFPFQAIPAATIPKGCYAPFSVITTNNAIVWIGGGENEAPGVWAYSSGYPEKISHEGIDHLLGQMTANELQAVVAWSYAENGAHFVGFGLDDSTIVYDFTSGRWHERKTRVYDEYGYPVEAPWRANAVVRAYNRTIVGDNASGKIGEASLNVYSEYGDEILRYFCSQPFENQGAPFRITKLEATTDSGAVSSDESDPQIRLAFSRDGAVFGPERSRLIGKVGERHKRQIWRKNGRFDRRAVIKISFSDKSKFALVKMQAMVA
jgi:hypothetical protein